MKMGNNILNVCYVTDNAYVQHTLVSIMSLVASQYCSTRVNVYVICDHVDSTYKKLLKALRTSNVKIAIVDYDNRFYVKKKYELGQYISSATYIRLKLPTIFSSIGKLLYIDGDTIVKNDLGELFGVDMTNVSVAGSLDYSIVVGGTSWDKIEYIRQTMPDYGSQYINAGVLMMNLDHMRKSGFEDACADLYSRRNDFIFADQDIVNFATVGSKKIMSVLWNCPALAVYANYSKQRFDDVKQMIADTYHISFGSFSDIVSKSKIIHYNGLKCWLYKFPDVRNLYETHLKMCLARFRSLGI